MSAQEQEVLTPEQLRSVWDEEAAKIDAPEGAAAPAPAAVEPVVVAAPAPAADAQPKPVAKVPRDPYAKLPEAVRTKLESVDKLAERVRSMEGNIGGLSEGHRHLKDLLSASQAAAAQVAQAPTQAAVQAAAASPEKWQSLKNDFPEWSEAVESFVDSRIAGVAPQPDAAIIDRLVDEKLAKIAPSIRREVSEDILDNEFEGWREKVNTQEFMTWLGAQDDAVKKLVNSDKVSDASKLLRLYTTPPVDPGKAILDARQQTLEAAASLPKGAHIPAVKSPEDMTPQELWAYEADQAAKRRAGRGY